MYDMDPMKWTDPSGRHHHHHYQHPQLQQQQYHNNGTIFMYQQQQHLPHLPIFIPPNTHFNLEDHSNLNNSLTVALSAETLAGVRLSESTMTCLNQGQSYDMKFKKHIVEECVTGYKSNIRLMFHDRRHQHSEQDQFQSWLATRTDQRLLELDKPLSVNVTETYEDPRTPNIITITWSGHNEASVSIKINCISTEFTAKKHGGEKGVPFRLQVDTYAVMGDEEHDTHLVHRSYCLVKVFKPNGADRKNKTSRVKMNDCPGNEKDQYHPSLKITSLKEVPQHDMSMFSPVKWALSEKGHDDKRSVNSISPYSSHSNHLTYSDEDMFFTGESTGHLSILSEIEDKVSSSSSKHNNMLNVSHHHDAHHGNHTSIEMDDSMHLDIHSVARRLQQSVLNHGQMFTTNDGSIMKMTNNQLLDLLRLTTYFDSNKLQDEPLKTIYVSLKESSDGLSKCKPCGGPSTNAKLVLTDYNHNSITIPLTKKNNKRSSNDDDENNGNSAKKKAKLSEEPKYEEQFIYSGIYLHSLTKYHLIQQICYVFNIQQQPDNVSTIYIIPKENIHVKVTDEEVKYMKNNSIYHLCIETDHTSGGKNMFLIAV